jgi:transposase
MAGWTGRCTSSTARSSGRTSTRPAQRGDPEAEALGRSRGGFTTKIHLRAERGGKPMVVVLTPGHRHEQPVLLRLMERGAVKRPGRGRPRVRPEEVAGDKGYSSPTVRRYLRGRRIAAVVPTKADEAPDPSFDRAAYRERNVVERLINRLKQFRRVATRYEKRAANYRAMVTIAAILLWL